MKQAAITKYFFCALLSVNSLLSCAQSSAVVKKLYSFYTERLPGNIAVDKNGNEIFAAIDTSIQVYVEASVKNIIWDTAWLNNKSYLIIVQVVTKDSIDAGTKRNGGAHVIIKARRGNYIWQLYLQPFLINKTNERYKKMTRENEILLKGKYKGMILLQKAGKPVPLEIIPSV
jgi:hypothetical protein